MTTSNKLYTEEEKEYIRKHVFELGVPAVAIKLGRTEEAIRVFAHKNNISVGDISWSDADTQYLLKHFQTKTTKEIGEAVGRSGGAVARKARDMGLRKRKGWTPEEEQFLLDNYRSMLYADIAKKLGKSSLAIRKKAFSLKLVKH
jgi:hypothetical protein